MIKTYGIQHSLAVRQTGATIYKRPGLYQLADLCVKLQKYGLLAKAQKEYEAIQDKKYADAEKYLDREFANV